jgi:hypothetical protein
VALAVAWTGCATPQSDAVTKAGAVMSHPWALKGDLVLVCEPKDAEVSVDELPWGVCADFGRDRGMTLGGGAHRVTVKKEGYAPYETVCEPSGAQARLSVTLRSLTKEGAVP